MKTFDSYFEQDKIIKYLAKLRIRCANSRNKKHLIHLLSNDPNLNYHIHEKNQQTDYQREFYDELMPLFPSRRKWKKLGRFSRLNSKSNEKLTTAEKNLYSILRTVKYYRNNFPNEPFVLRLNKFIGDIQSSIKDPNYKISPPIIYPKLKEKISKTSKNECRPICLFKLKDRVILSLTNKYFTQLFDDYFEDCSFAFRSKRNIENKVLSHHDSVQEILDYRAINESKLYVVECDMEKFYDSVSHLEVIKAFETLMNKTEEKYSDYNFNDPKRIFKDFLDSYSFNHNVLPLNDHSHHSEYWEAHHIPFGFFKWVEKGLSNYYGADISNHRIGVPQGGALSGLIANMVLDKADKKIINTGVFYTRFCDDMIILSPDKNLCELAKSEYLAVLKSLKLVPHSFNDQLIVDRAVIKKGLPLKTIKPFWESKSKGVYKWDDIKNGGFPWIGFVGYEIHHQGYIRVRKKSLKKEFDKQKKVVNQILSSVKKGSRKSIPTIKHSLIHRLIGMSVGRIGLHNFNTAEPVLCWKNGFIKLTKNWYSEKQMKYLDNNRNKLFYRLNKQLNNTVVSKSEKKTRKRNERVNFDKPFSYYYQVIERNE